MTKRYAIFDLQNGSKVPLNIWILGDLRQCSYPFPESEGRSLCISTALATRVLGSTAEKICYPGQLLLTQVYPFQVM